MPNLKISQLTAGNPAQSADVVPVDRGGTNVSVTAASVSALATANGAEATANKDAASGYAGLTSGTLLKAAEFPAPTSSTFGGVKSLAAVSHSFLTSIGTDGIPVAAVQIPGLSGVGMPNLVSAVVKNRINTQATSGENDFYTVAANKRATIALYAVNTTAGTASYKLQIKSGGVYYSIQGASTTVATNATSQISVPFNSFPLLEAGDGFSVLINQSTLSSIVGNGTTWTGTTAEAHNMVAGQLVNIAGTSVFNGTGFTLATASGTTFTITNATNNGVTNNAAGQTVAMTTTAGMNIFGYVVEYDNTESLKSAYLLTLASGANTVYTCPANKIATILNVQGQNAPLRTANNSGATRTYTWYLIPSGGSQTTATQFAATFTSNNVTSNSIANSPAGLAAGDFISINSDSSAAGQVAYALNIIELPVGGF